MLSWESLIGLVLILAPPVVWSFPRFLRRGFGFLENLVWWVAGLQAAALLTLGAGRFAPVPFLAVYLVLIAAATRIRLRSPGGPPAGPGPTFADGFLASLVIVAVWVPADVYADVPRRIDALVYHLPMAAQWVQTGTLQATDCGVWYYPGGYELLTAVFFLVAGGDVLWFVPDLISWTILVAALPRLLRGLGVGRRASALVTGALLMSPLLREHLACGNNDLLVGGLAVAGVAAFLETGDGRGRRARAAGIVAFGALAGTKYGALPLMLLLVPLAVIQARRPARRFGGLEAAAVVLAAVLAAGFPLRNFLLTGNPFYPVGLAGLFPWGDLSQLAPRVPALTADQLAGTSLIRQGWPAWSAFLGAVWKWAFFLPVLAVFAALGAILRPRRGRVRPPGAADVLVLAACALSFAAFILQPLVVDNHPGTLRQIADGWSLRFGLAWILLLAAWFHSRLPGRLSLPVAAFLLAVVLVEQDLFQYAVVVLGANLVLHPVLRFRIRWWAPLGWLVPLALAAVPLVADHVRPVQARNAYRDAYYARGESAVIPFVLEDPASRVIVINGGLRAWPLIGHDLRNRVVQVGMSRPAEDLLGAADTHRADLMIVPKSLGGDGLPHPGRPFTEMLRLGRIAGPGWTVGYEDSLVVAYSRVAPEVGSH